LTLYIMRHAESEANAAGILAGQIDYPLTERGRADAAAVADAFLRGRRLDRVIASPLIRARQTAAPFAAAAGLTVETEAALLEQDMGIFAGKTYAWSEAHPAYMADRAKRWDWRPPDGESYRMIAERLAPWFAGLDREAGRAGAWLVVTHAVTIRLIAGILAGTLPEYPEKILRNGEMLTVDYRGGGFRHEPDTLYFGADAVGRA
jgi:broad specificity phosphatase PhoE